METTVVDGEVDWRAPFGFDNFATIVLALNLATYFNQVMHFDIATTSNMLTNFMGTSCNLAVVIACFADTHVARYKVAIVSAFVEFLGHGLLGLQAHNPRLKPSVCNILNPTSHCEKVKGGNAALLYIMLYSIALGKAGVKVLVWIIVKVGWDWGFSICALGILLGALVFAAGVPRNRIQAMVEPIP